MVISGGNFKPDTLKPKEVVSLLLDDDELEKKRECFEATRLHLDSILFFFFTINIRRKFKKKCILSSPVVRQRQEEKRQLEESSKVKERKRKREKYAEKVQYISVF